MNRFIALLLLVIAVVASAASVGRDDYVSTREEILATRQRRKSQYAEILADYQQQLAHHEEGRRRLSSQEEALIKRKLNAYRRKLETYKEDFDDRVSHLSGNAVCKKKPVEINDLTCRLPTFRMSTGYCSGRRSKRKDILSVANNEAEDGNCKFAGWHWLLDNFYIIL